MSELILKKADLEAFLTALGQTYEVFAPAPVEGEAFYDYKKYQGGPPPLEKVRPRLSIKKFFHPQQELMFRYTTDPKAEACNILEPILPAGQRVLFGVSSCDARSVVLNGLVFVNDPTNPHQDPYYKARWDETVLIGWGCDQPCVTCFCHAVGGHPFGEEGLDAILTDLGDRLVVKVLTDKGAQALKLADLSEAPPTDKEKAAEVAQKAREAMPGGLKLGQPASQNLMALFELPLWEETAARCLNCGICTYLCPTCYCFDLLDETQGRDGVRFRIWDSCMYPLYTLHASGHNPRPTKTERLRQRFMHKLKYFPDRHGTKVSCVGCGRCIVHCPVNIDIREVAARMKAN